MKQEEKDELAYVTSILQKEVTAIETALRGVTSKEEKAILIGHITSIKFSQQLLRRCFEYKINPRAVWRRIPMPQHIWSEYRLLEDFDSDNQEYWKEVHDIRPSGGDVLIG
ncbi:hypothetical protein [Hymenobacter terrenus]|uniref:hypothetical protein n=1 Tax=Hymenobacter terrenus TaxID=1629124 RepID=UPI000619469E|nr:hypothetical protein [Hymenobacter terrenus]